jgi:hypothetical protein
MNDYIPITSNEALGLFSEWWRKHPYVIRKGTYTPYRGEGLKPVSTDTKVLVPTGKRIQRYAPIQKTELLNALLDVAQERATPVEFANRFGLLGYNYEVPRENYCEGGDPLDWFAAQAHTVRTLAELIERLGEAKESTGGRRHLANYLKEELTTGPYALGGRVAEISFSRSATNPVMEATGIARYLLNANLGEVGRRLMASGLRSIFTFRSLAQVLHWQLADQIGQSSIHRCAECGRIFIATNLRSRFCPPSGGKKISACKSRWNVRKFRKKQRKGMKR